MKKVFLSIILIAIVQSISAQTTAKSINSFCDWDTFKNPYHAMQVRYKLEKQVGDLGYFQVQFRINYDETSLCKDSRCEGYALSFGYPVADEKQMSYLSLKFYYPYKDIYTVPELIAIKLNLPDGSKRFLRQDGFYYIAKDGEQESYLEYYFSKAATEILSGSRVSIRDFNESSALIIR